MTRAAVATADPTITTPAVATPAASVVTPPSGLTGPSVGYLQLSALPLTSLLFLVPLIVVYEVGTRWYAVDPVSHVEQRIVAFNLMQQFFALFGATGQYMPAGAVVSILLFWHVARNDQVFPGVGTLLTMGAESTMSALPLVGLGFLFQHFLPLQTSTGDPRPLLVLSVGAGVYEEMMFRLVAFTLLSFLLVDLLAVPKARAVPVMVVVSAVAFSLYHYRLPVYPFYLYLGSEPFDWQSFAFRTMAGIYFGLIFVWRGFGLTAGSHAAYDLLIVLLRAS